MKIRKTQTLYNSITNIDDKYIQEALAAKKGKKPVWIKWGAIAACLCLICVSAIAIPNLLITIPDEFKSGPAPDNGPTSISDGGHSQIVDDGQTPLAEGERTPIAEGEQAARDQEVFVPITSLLASRNNGMENLAAAFGKVSIGEYTGVYESVPSMESAVLSQNKGSNISGTKEWYYISGHSDMQYLIRNVNEEYSLWKFSCFSNEEYPYCDVLELVYQIDSADAISEIIVNPARMDNTDGGKAIQEKIGTLKIKDREEIDTIYQILSSLTCYGSNHWDMIDYGDAEAPADTKKTSHQAVLLGRYLSIVTDYGNEIDGLKYTAVSDMFYEFSGIAYNRLTAEQAESVNEILRITESVEELQNRDISENDELLKDQSMENKRELLLETDNTNVSLEYVTELQNKVSTAMINGELPFVITSAVYENPYRLHIVVTSNSESDLQKLRELDSLGGALEIEYAPGNVNQWR